MLSNVGSIVTSTENLNVDPAQSTALVSVKRPTIAVDAMGGDYGVKVVVPGAVQAGLASHYKIIFIGDEALIQDELKKLDCKDLDFEIVHTTEVAAMHEKPSDILRRKKDATIQIACRLVKEGRADVLVSAGHSGASVACGMFILGRISGVERPALATILPTSSEPMILLDVGANVDCKPYHLFQFGLMGASYACDLLGRENPRVGLLSIGEEEGKGNILVKESYDLLKLAQKINFVGNVEGRDLFTGELDVAVCDGFVGNVALKVSEGLSSAFNHILKRELSGSGLSSKLGAYLARPAFKNFKKVVDYAEYGGAPILGLKSPAFVSHGSSNIKAICSAVNMAADFVIKDTNKRLIDTISANEELTRYSRSV